MGTHSRMISSEDEFCFLWNMGQTYIINIARHNMFIVSEGKWIMSRFAWPACFIFYVPIRSVKGRFFFRSSITM